VGVPGVDEVGSDGGAGERDQRDRRSQSPVRDAFGKSDGFRQNSASTTEAADVTGRYIADQPVRSVLVAAAAGAAITALIVLASRRSRDDY